MFTLRDIQKYKGEVVEAEWMTALPIPFVGEIAQVIGAKKVYEKETGRWYWGLPPKVKHVIETANPMLRNLGKMIPRGEERVPHYRREKRPWDIMSSFLGLKLIPYNLTESVERSVFERRDIVRDIRRTAERQGKVPSYYLREAPEE